MKKWGTKIQEKPKTETGVLRLGFFALSFVTLVPRPGEILSSSKPETSERGKSPEARRLLSCEIKLGVLCVSTTQACSEWTLYHRLDLDLFYTTSYHMYYFDFLSSLPPPPPPPPPPTRSSISGIYRIGFKTPEKYRIMDRLHCLVYQSGSKHFILQ